MEPDAMLRACQRTSANISEGGTNKEEEILNNFFETILQAAGQVNDGQFHISYLSFVISSQLTATIQVQKSDFVTHAHTPNIAPS